MIDIRSTYHIALNNIGLILQGSPEQPAYVLEQASVFNNRFAQGDRTYDDFAKWWYWAQTDWFQGLKDDVKWSDDGRYYYATNIDAWSEIGAIKLSKQLASVNDFAEGIICGAELSIDGVTNKYIGTEDDTGGKPVIYKFSGGNWNNISNAQMSTNQNLISQMLSRSGIGWFLTIGVGATNVVLTYDGTNWTDQSANINIGASLSNQPMSSRCGVEVGGVMYIFVDNSINNQYALVKTTVANPAASGDWSLVFETTNALGLPISCAEYDGNIYYLEYGYSTLELRKYDIANDIDSHVRTFKNASASSWGVGDKYLVVHNGKLIITVPTNEVWEMDGTTLTRIYKKDEYKRDSISSAEAVGNLSDGAIISDNKVWWGNLMYDGVRFYNTFKPSGDSSSASLKPLFVDGSDVMYFYDSVDDTILWSYTHSGSTYKGSDNKNFVVLNQFDKVSGIDKILYSVTLIFKAFASGQSIEIEYTTGALTSSTTWTSLGVASATLDGTSVTEKTLYFPANTTCKKVWYRIKLEGGGSNTPVLYDVVTAYLPRPFADKQWRLNVDCGDELTLVNGSKENRNGREIKGRIEAAWLTNQIVDFQDVDYAQTLLNGSLTNSATTITVDDTSQFPEVGRLKIDDEVIYYTGKTPTTFTGCSRGQKGTKAVSHSDNATAHNGYKVIIQSFNARVPIINNEKRLEYILGLSLREVI